MNEKNGRLTAPVTYMWCAHTATDRAAIAMVANDQALVAEDRLAAEHREDLGGDAEERQREDVDLGVPEEPEQVLPQDRAAVRRRRRPACRTCGRPRGRAAPRPAPGTPSARGSLVSSMFQVKIGIRNIVMPGARMQKIVVMKLTAPRIVPRPPRVKPMIHRSAPTFGRVDRVGQRRVGEPAEATPRRRG